MGRMRRPASATAHLLPLLLALATACSASRAPEARTADAPPPAPAAATAPATAHAVARENPAPSPALRALLGDPDRSAKDRALDAGRKPAELLAFGGVHPGSRVAEVGAWEGYGAELLARAVAPDDKVYAIDPPDFDK